MIVLLGLRYLHVVRYYMINQCDISADVMMRNASSNSSHDKSDT